MGNFTIKRLNSFKSLFFVVLFFVFVPAKANALFAVTSASPFFQGFFLKNCTATSFAFKEEKDCKSDWYNSIVLCKNNVDQKLRRGTTSCNNSVCTKTIKIFFCFDYNDKYLSFLGVFV